MRERERGRADENPLLFAGRYNIAAGGLGVLISELKLTGFPTIDKNENNFRLSIFNFFSLFIYYLLFVYTTAVARSIPDFSFSIFSYPA